VSEIDYEGLKASDWTQRKQDNFAQFLRAYAAIAGAIQRKYRNGRLAYVELTAGPGIIDDRGYEIRGSPIIALDTFRNEVDFLVDCVFVEQDRSRFNILTNVVDRERSSWSAEDRSRIHVSLECSDNKSVLSRGLPLSGPYGLIYWDGLGRDTYPSIEAREWLEAHSMHDLLLMASGTAPKRKGCPRLDRMLHTVPRRVWISDTNGPWQWVFALATSWSQLAEKLSSYCSIKLYPSTSIRGAKILDHVGSTYVERQKRQQPELWSRSEST
jgi:hypothetical protein